MKLKFVPWLLAALLLGAMGLLYSANQKQSAELAKLREESQELQQLRAAAEEAKQTQGSAEELTRLRKENEELLRLRNEVRQLRTDKQQMTKQLQSAQAQAQSAQAQAQGAQAARQNPGQPGQELTEAQAEAFRKRYGLAQANPQELCINNLRQIEGAKQQWALENGKPKGAIFIAADLFPYLRTNTLPACPAGGIYTLNPVGIAALCSIPGHVLPKP